jgi:NADH:ubiquinone oxidoreductase subunit 4 (subunit M)
MYSKFIYPYFNFLFFTLLISLIYIFKLNLLFVNLFLPLLSILLMYLFSNTGNKFIHQFALNITAFCFILSILMFLLVDKGQLAFFDYQFSIFLIPSLNFDILLGIDGISLSFVLLTNLFIYLCILSIPTYQVKLYEILMYLFLLQ